MESADSKVTAFFDKTGLLMVTGGILSAPETWLGAGALGAAVGALFWVRPNAGAIALALVLARYVLTRRYVAGLRAAVAFLVVVVPIALATQPSPGGPELRGLAYPLLVGSTDYFWAPAVAPVQAADLESRQREEIRLAREGWRFLWQSLRRGEPDASRQIVWRAFHGLLGTDYYDARWSTAYLALTGASRLLTPILLIAAFSLFLTLPFRGPERSMNAVALLLAGLLVVQNLVLGSLPRYDLPFLPLIVVFGVRAADSIRRDRMRGILAAALFLLLTALTARCRYVLDWEWGAVESAGVALRQPIPRHSLPAREPATLHVRIGGRPPAAAQFDVYGPKGRLLFSGTENTAPHRPDVAIRLPQWLLDQNARESTEIRIVSTIGLNEGSFLLFPLVPPPWAQGARREESDSLSPSTGVRRGSLDWWAHPGTDGLRGGSTQGQ